MAGRKNNRMSSGLLAPLRDYQRALAQQPLERTLYLEGPAGAGKTTAAVARLLWLLEAGVAANTILVLVPQRTLATPYVDALRAPTLRAGCQVTVLTVGGLARRMVDLFWPLIAEGAGFAHPDQPPGFLTLETAQYTMARLVRPLLDQGYFESVVLDRNRLYSQILDNLNKSAVVGFSHREIGPRLKAAWGGEVAQRHIYDEAQECAARFRTHCLAHNLLDFSLQVEVFMQHLWKLPVCRRYLLQSYRHILVDNVEEDTPVAHDLLRDWIAEASSALLVVDRDGGYRRFLGADAEGAGDLRAACDEAFTFEESLVMPPRLQVLGWRIGNYLRRTQVPLPSDVAARARGEPLLLGFDYHRFHPQMLDWVAQNVARLVRDEGVPPGEIAILAPFLSDALRFSLANRLERLGVPVRSHRPSRALRDEPAARCLLTLASLAHPAWGRCPSRSEVAYALMEAIERLDLVRAQLLTRAVYSEPDRRPTLGSFDDLGPELQERITYVLGERYERLRLWLLEYAGPTGEIVGASEASGEEAFDHFLGRLFGELLSQPGFGFHARYDAGAVAANLIESVRKFRSVARVSDGAGANGAQRLGLEYVELVDDGVIAAQYVESWRLQPEDAVLVAPAYTFLMMNRPVEIQFWLNVGSSGWWERLYQPLTQPYVLSRRWPVDGVWTDADEVQARHSALHRLVLGLLRRCRRGIYLGLSELSEQGDEQRGVLLQAIHRALRESA